MKFNWGTGIALFYGTFAIGMVGVVFAARRHDPGLVQKDYYALDLRYQERLERKQHAAALPEKPAVLVNGSNRQLTIQMPAGMETAVGSVKFYRSTTTRDDFSASLEQAKPLQLSTEKMAAGRWHAELEWEAAGQKYFWETTFWIAGN